MTYLPPMDPMELLLLRIAVGNTPKLEIAMMQNWDLRDLLRLLDTDMKRIESKLGYPVMYCADEDGIIYRNLAEARWWILYLRGMISRQEYMAKGGDWNIT